MQSHINRSCGLALFLACAFGTYAQIPTTCVVSAAPVVVHSEGLAERIGEIVLQCSGTPGAAVTATLNIFLPVSITNRINAAG